MGRPLDQEVAGLEGHRGRGGVEGHADRVAARSERVELELEQAADEATPRSLDTRFSSEWSVMGP